MDALKTRHEVYNKTIEDIHNMEAKGELFVIRPSEKLTIGRMESDLDEIKRVYEIGRKDAEKDIRRMKEWLKETSG